MAAALPPPESTSARSLANTCDNQQNTTAPWIRARSPVAVLTRPTGAYQAGFQQQGSMMN